MKYSNSFYHDLDFAESAEGWVKQLLSDGFKVEVKSDKIAHKTGNVFVEVYSRGNPSGISTTNAEYWIFRIDENNSAIIVSSKRLKELVKIFFNGNFTKGGDCDTSLGVLIPIKDLWR